MTVRNQQLFSHAYLKTVRVDDAAHASALALARQIREWASTWDFSSPQKALYTSVLPTLDALGFSYAPDPNDARCQLLFADMSKTDMLGTLFVAPPRADLDGTHKGSHWMFLAVHAAKRHDRRWALLTDGLRWRLLNARHIIPYEVFLELNLSGIKGQGDSSPGLARALHAFFRRDAWLRDAEGRCPLDGHHDASVKATEATEDHLKHHIETVLGNICRGFIDTDGRATYTEEERAAIYDAATIVIYRILFALYAEARGLLPVEDPVYAAQGMRSLIETALAYQKEMPDPDATTLWDGLRRLWGWIDRGNPELGVPAYNGGLFDDERDADLGRDLTALREYSVPDSHLTDALVHLTTMPTKEGSERIDYRDLSVRHLGSLYEGMLEYKLFIVQEPMLARRAKKGTRYLLASETTEKKNDKLLEPGNVYFAQSPGERKATGSYYTPEFIVDYIVEHTVRVGLEERRQTFETELEEKQLTPVEADAALGRFVEEKALTFRVCDPAMGSGHFLVNAAHTVTSFIVETLNRGDWANADLDCDPVHWRRRVVGSCIYGVDINPLAVELAKLSLWLITVERRKALSFLDHHLRCGNSLIGARLEELPVAELAVGQRVIREKGVPEEQLSFLDLPGVQESMRGAVAGALQLEGLPDNTPDDVHAKTRTYQELRQALMRRYSRIANLSVARHLGLDLDEKTYRRLVQGYLGGDTPYVPRFAARAVTQTERIFEQYRIFHWQLEFPQVFFDADGSLRGAASGFGAVVGNPPYVRQEMLGNAKAFFLDQYEVYHSTADLYAYFVERGVKLCSGSGHFSYVVSNKWLRASYGRPLREYLRHQRLEELVDFGSLPVFDTVSAYPCILRTARGEPRDAMTVVKPDSLGFQSLTRYVAQHSFEVTLERLDDSGWALLDEGTHKLLDKLETAGRRLEQYASSRVYRGIVTGLNAAFVIDEAKRTRLIEEEARSADLIKPWLEGRNIKRYRLDWPCMYVIYMAWDTPIEKYSAIRKYLQQHRDRLENRSEVRVGRYAWYAMSRYAAKYVSEFEKPKIVWPNMCVRLRFAYDTRGYYVCAPANLLTVPRDRIHILGILNSSLVGWFMRQTAAERGGGFLEYKPTYVRQLSIPSSRDEIRARIGGRTEDLLKLQHDVQRTEADSISVSLQERIAEVEHDIDQAVYELYGLDEPEIAIVEGRGGKRRMG